MSDGEIIRSFFLSMYAFQQCLQMSKEISLLTMIAYQSLLCSASISMRNMCEIDKKIFYRRLLLVG